MLYVIIKDGVVEACGSASALDDVAPFYADCSVMEVADVVDVGSTYAGGVFTPPVINGLTEGSITKLAFLRRFPTAKRIGIRAAALTDPILSDALQLLDAAQDVNTSDPDTQLLVGYCVQQGLLTVEESASILST